MFNIVEILKAQISFSVNKIYSPMKSIRNKKYYYTLYTLHTQSKTKKHMKFCLCFCYDIKLPHKTYTQSVYTRLSKRSIIMLLMVSIITKDVTIFFFSRSQGRKKEYELLSKGLKLKKVTPTKFINFL